MDRWVEDRTVYALEDGQLRPLDRGVTHYRFAFEGHMVGERLRHELVAAGLPATVQVTAYPHLDGDGADLEVILPGDDQGAHAAALNRTLDAHEGTEAADHKALVEFAGSVHDAARRLLEGGNVTDAERDVLIALAVQGGMR